MFSEKVFSIVSAITIAVSGFVFPVTPPPDNFGATITVPVASFSTSLASKITSSDTTMTLVSATTDDGTTLTAGSVYGFVLDANTASEEFVSGTVSTTPTVIINMSRGLSVVTGDTEISALKKEHRRGTSVKITDAPVLLILSRVLNGDETIPNILSYASSSGTFTANEQVVNKGYVDGVAFSGAPDASDTVKGVSEVANRTEAASSTPTGSGDTTAPLILTTTISTSTCQTATSSVIVSQSDGYISQNCTDFSLPFVFTGGVSTTNFTANSVTSSVSAVTGTSTVNNLVITGDTTGFTAPSTYDISLGSFSTSTANLTVSVLTHTLGVSPEKISIFCVMTDTTNRILSVSDGVYTSTTQSTFSGGNSVSAFYDDVGLTGASFEDGSDFIHLNEGSGDMQGRPTSITSSGFNITWAKASSPVGTVACRWEAEVF